MENNQYKFKRQCVFRSGKFEGFYGWKSIVGHSVALFGLAYGIRTAWLYVVKPAGKAVTPSFQNLYNSVKEDILGTEKKEPKPNKQ